MTELTLLNIKPDGVEKKLIGEIIRRVESKGYRILAIDRIQLTEKEAEAFYEIHRGKPFFNKLIDYMCSGPCVPMVVEGENVIEGIRTLIGVTDPQKAAEGTIRQEYGEDVTRNCVHASDGPETARMEIGFFFSRRNLLE